ncbi:sugar kinase [Oxalicibacterium flavum]|uniref:Sugar kinase n=1 Tax=Oxalicibacterium flavum TaxID=179467 RepID=A0A8J2UQJ0_9BURK|nr:ROK family protein [Oxalicibacterium flavum]GGC14415.1 sugar kinase [Oxalicibacterium flavum]
MQYIAGIDIGGTKMAVSIADRNGPLVRIAEATVKLGTPRAPAEQAVSMLRSACERIGISLSELGAVGVSSCGPFVKHGGLIHLVAPNICGGIGNRGDLLNDWESVPLEQVLREHFTHVAIQNDCVAALAAERAFGALHNEDNCAYVTWSTGIGFGLCVDGRLLHGKNGNAGHAGHMLLTDQSQAQCGCGNYGDTEALASGRNLEVQYGRSPEELFNAVKEGDVHAHAAVVHAAKWFGRALYNVTATLDLRVFAIGGSIWHHHGDWLEPIVREEICSHLPALTQGVQLIRPALDAHVADAGALYLVMPDDWVADWRQLSLWDRIAETEME